jgi:gentisate 1,2-dioxygenase
MSSEQTRNRTRDVEASEANTRLYEPQIYDYAVRELDRAAHGQIVVKAKNRTWDVHRQANSKRYLSRFEPDLQNTATQGWETFLQVFQDRSGRHRHQGGLVIFILEGKGYTVIDGMRHEWEAGDLMLLKMKPNGVEHQHFNTDPERPAKWIALMYMPFFDYGGSEITQLENSPIYDKWMARLAEREAQMRANVQDKPKRAKPKAG